jgi:hypothetical protein
MSLRDQIAQDARVFFNLDELGETHTIDGKPVVCVLDSMQADQASGLDTAPVWVERMQLYAKTADLKALPQGMPRANRVLNVDGKQYMVIKPVDEVGITRVDLEVVGS